MRDCFERGEFPFASHLLYTQESILDDEISDERIMGIFAGFEWARRADADATVIYGDRGLSAGMSNGIAYANMMYRPIEIRYLYEETKGLIDDDIKRLLANDD